MQHPGGAAGIDGVLVSHHPLPPITLCRSPQRRLCSPGSPIAVDLR
ncbi:hypothetical protein HMPREF1979_00745 [Actinomyces johnsonii F0542]|uniref:Uncharacterized protein n=1 Tax=Actinomyces johnsonii F0542 TaxID=1321818 RepID=U1QT97_9ACTO|nr:hypothetical protein HMPREF1979_00745 [Actinomyces johnsonii F0542]